MNIYSTLIPSREKFNDTIDGILRKPGYRHLSQNFLDFVNNIKEGLRKKIEDILEALSSNISNIPEVSEGLSNIFLIVGLIILIAIIIFIVVKINKIRDKRVKISEIFGEKIDENTTKEKLREMAKQYIGTGEYRQAIRYEFIALLLLMHENGLVTLDETKTGEELYQFLKKNGFKGIGDFKILVNIFNSTWYGRKGYDQRAYEKWENSFKLIWNGVIGNEEKAK